MFTNFQAASVVIGQPDFTSDDPNQGGGTPQANTLGEGVYGTSTVAGNRLWVADYDNHRALGFDGIPAANNASASWVVGQPDFISDTAGTSATEFTGIQQAIEHNGFFYLLEYDNHRVTTFDSVPLTPPGTASHVLGQPDLTSNTPACSASGMFEPETMFITDNRLLVADAGNHRVLVWNTLPISTDGQAPDLVLGQGVFDSCAGNDDDQNGAEDTATARTLDLPTAVWSDGTRLVVLDSNNHRVLIWNTFPDSHFAPADVVLGQSDFVHGTANDDDQDDADDGAPSARTLAFPYEGIWSNGLQLFVSDTANNRILIWNDFPTENFVPADVVLGQSDFTRNTANDDDQDGADDATPSERTLNGPVGLTTSRDKLVLHDQNNSRALVFESE